MADDTKKNSLESETTSAQHNRPEGVITVVLTADNHLGDAAFGQPRHKREEHQQRLRLAFQQATDFAIAQGVDLFIQAGDLFDTTTPDERDRSFVAERLAQLKHADIHTFALGGVHDTPSDTQFFQEGEAAPAPLISYARLGALHYFPPLQRNDSQELEPVMLDIRGTRVGICGLSVLPGLDLSHLRVYTEIENAAIPILVLHAPIEGLKEGLQEGLDLSELAVFRYILAGYHHCYSRSRSGEIEIIVAGASQHVDFSAPDHDPGFVFLGLAADGIRWCQHISVDGLVLRRLNIRTSDLWPDDPSMPQRSPTEVILDQLRPLCNPDTMVQVRLEGELMRSQYHQLDLNQIRRYGEEHCFALAIDDSALALLPDQALSAEIGKRFSPREELIALADEWIAASSDEHEKKALQITKEELLLAMDEIKGKR